jgi:uncharacterized tellurite resistance protein B-like protein
MMRRLREMLLGAAGPDAPGHDAFDETAFATAALMSEATSLDGRYGGEQRQRSVHLLQQKYELDAPTAEALLGAAETRISDTHQILPFTRTLKDELSEAERIEVVEMLWEVIYANGEVHDYEAGLMRRIAGLIYVQDVDMGAARKRVLARLAPGQDTDTP